MNKPIAPPDALNYPCLEMTFRLPGRSPVALNTSFREGITEQAIATVLNALERELRKHAANAGTGPDPG